MFYACATPLWEGFDEYVAVASLESVASGSLLPPVQPVLSREIESSLRTVPLPRGLAGSVPAAINHDEFWRLPEQARVKRSAGIHKIPTEWRTQPGVVAAIEDSRRAPLYFWLMRPIYSMIGGIQLVERVFILRMLNVLMASFAIPLAFLLALEVLDDAAAALCATAALAAMPQVMMNIAHVGSEPLALLMATALALAAIRVRNTTQPVLFGVLLGLALLAEAHFIVLPAVCVLAVIRRWRTALVIAAVPAAIAGWWYVLRWIPRTGAPIASMFGSVAKVDWVRTADFAWYTLVWAGNGSFLGLRSWTYRIMLLVILAAIFGLARARNHKKGPVWILIGFHVALALALAFEALREVQYGGAAITPGWYLGCLAGAGACLAVYGFRAITPGAVAVPAFVFAALDLYGLHVVLMPYYAGLIAYSSTGRLAAFPLGRWSYIVFDRLALNKPLWVNSMALSGLWAAYTVGTFALIGIAVWVGRAVRVDVCRSTE